MSSPEGDLQIYQDISTRLGNARVQDALHDLVQGAEVEHGLVPLVTKSMRNNVLDVGYDKVEGLVIVGIDKTTSTVGMGVAPPSDMGDSNFVEMCRDLNYALQQPMRASMSELLTGLSSRGRSLVTAVSYVSSGESDTGMAALHVPGYYMNEGYDLIRETNLDDPNLRELNPEQLSTLISSALFDYFSGVHLEHR